MRLSSVPAMEGRPVLAFRLDPAENLLASSAHDDNPCPDRRPGCGEIIQSRWALLLPLAVGACGALAIAATGHGLNDTPIPFLVVVRVGHGRRPGLRSRRAHVA